jgi:hypothetical protein
MFINSNKHLTMLHTITTLGGCSRPIEFNQVGGKLNNLPTTILWILGLLCFCLAYLVYKTSKSKNTV